MHACRLPTVEEERQVQLENAKAGCGYDRRSRRSRAPTPPATAIAAGFLAPR
jgi:hypothetical protein